jgi:hypothetical protein
MHLFDRIEVVEQSTHRTWFGIDVAFWHGEIIGAEDTFARTSKGLGQDLYRDNS